jgi:hypothetical protein
MNRPDDYEPGNEADELLQTVVERDLTIEERGRLVARAQVLATLQIALETKRVRLALVELARVIVDELGG